MSNIQFYTIDFDSIELEEQVIKEPTKNEVSFAENAIKWGQKKGVISLINPERTKTVYFKSLNYEKH